MAAEPLAVSILCDVSGVCIPAEDSEAVEICEAYLSSQHKARLMEKHGWGTGLPKLLRETCPPEQLARADALRALPGMEKRADRAEICNRVGELFECPECGRAFKGVWGCGLRSCPNCGKKIFNRVFAELAPLDEVIPAALRSLPGWGWKILDFSFYHDGDFPSREEMREMRRVVNRVTDRTVHEKCRELYLAGKGCRLRFETGGAPMMFEGWPVASARDGSARVLKGWVAVRVGRIGKVSKCLRCGSRVKKIKGQHARQCPKCGPVEWPDWENQEVDNQRWKLRFGIIHIPVSEFGFDNTNYHFHTCFFGPYLEQSRLAEIFREESRKALGQESQIVWVQAAKRGFRSTLAHALKYTAKQPSSTPEKLARYESVLVGVRRYAKRGFLQGVVLEEKKRGAPKCPDCKKELKRVPGLGVVPLSEIQDIPFLPDDEPDYADEFKADEFCFFEPEEMAANAPRAPC